MLQVLVLFFFYWHLHYFAVWFYFNLPQTRLNRSIRFPLGTDQTRGNPRPVVAEKPGSARYLKLPANQRGACRRWAGPEHQLTPPSPQFRCWRLWAGPPAVTPSSKASPTVCCSWETTWGHTRNTWTSARTCCTSAGNPAPSPGQRKSRDTVINSI